MTEMVTAVKNVLKRILPRKAQTASDNSHLIPFDY